MKFHLSSHAINQIEARSVGYNKRTGEQVTVATESDVLSKVSKLEDSILAGKVHASVIVKTFDGLVVTRDGKSPDQWSNGDCLVAVCDPHTHKIVTVMLQRKEQVYKRQRQGTPYYK